MPECEYSLLIYLDTNIWNDLCDHAVDPKRFSESLGSKHASIVLSFPTVFELARTFKGAEAKGPSRGIRLFSCLKGFLDLGIPCTKEIMELLRAEVWAFKQGLREIEGFLRGEDFAKVTYDVSNLANGVVEGRVEQSIEERTALAKATRYGQIDHLKGREDMKRKLKEIPESQLAQWMASEMMTLSGADNLCDRLRRLFGYSPTRDYASALLASPVANVAKGLVRADLYYNWRCANRDSNPPDLMDDMHHVLQATYCDVYVTAESKQLDYANLLLSASTHVAIYDRQMPVDRWLETLA
jgi:hypothetical protein